MNRQELHFTETYGNRRVQGIIFTDPLPPERKEAVRRLFPTEDPRSSRQSWCSTYCQPDTWPRNTTCHAQTGDYPRPQALRRGTLHPITYLDPQTYLSPNYLAQYSPQNLEGTPRCKDILAPHPPNWEPFRWSVTKQSSWQKPLLPTSNTQRNSNTSYLLVRCFFFFFAAQLGKYFVLRSYPARLRMDTFSNSLLDRRSLLAFCQVRVRCSERSLELVAHWPSVSVRTKEKKRGKKAVK